MKHRDLCEAAAMWLAKRKSAQIAVAEPPVPCPEMPDAFGWTRNGHTLAVEVKVSRADFLADRGKHHRSPTSGMGAQRWFLCPPGIAAADEIQPGWGYLTLGPRGGVHEVLVAPYRQSGEAEFPQDKLGVQWDLAAVSYIAQRIIRFDDLDPETLRFRRIQFPGDTGEGE